MAFHPDIILHEERISSRQEQPAIDPLTLDPAALLHYMDDHPQEMMQCIDRLQDRQRAIDLTRQLVEEIQGPHFSLLTSWAAKQRDPQVAAAVLDGMAARWLSNDPEGCVAFGARLDDSDAGKKAKETLYMTATVEQRLALLEQMNPEQRAWIYNLRPGALAGQNPEAMLTGVSALPDSPDRTAAMQKLTRIWVAGSNDYHLSDPAHAVQAIGSIQDDTLRREALRTATSEWSGVNPRLAGQWIASLAPGSDRDAALGGMAARLAAEDPEAARAWASKISNSSMRERELTGIDQASATKKPPH